MGGGDVEAMTVAQELSDLAQPLSSEVQVWRGVRSGKWYPSNREAVDFGVIIGMYRDATTGRGRRTTRGTIHYSKTGAHVVPAEPAKENPR